jgi:AraC-like DNA-binding protein
MIEFDFFIGTYDDAVNAILKWLGKKPVNSVIHFDQDTGNGFLLLIELEKGFFVRAWDYQLKENTKFNIRSVPEGSPPVFMINYLLMPESFMIESGHSWPQKTKKVSQFNNIIFSTNNSQFSFIVKAGKQAKALDICFTMDWLLQQFPPAMHGQLKMSLLPPQNREPFLIQTFSVNDYKIVGETIEKVFKEGWDSIFLKSRALTLVNELMESILNKKTASAELPGAAMMLEIEKKLTSNLREKLPNLQEIAREFSMSDSTLKRRFKQVYGKAIYEFYLEKKMDLARKMLVETDMTVSQVAYSLGYEKASPFIKIFKKHFGVSPGALRIS